ncbi:dihydrodipicolinate synthase family protein [Salicibibacter cibarius]|uniref:Dihydrodipicolinate synthase family protein n=2 Tax=Salicibibacter cibarius TaxID=2743000 RepID=A0A7T7CDY8_9BACI|nr:dihydrodipicolinate synthase family protein [Salicibibacter cibarius]
MPFDADLNIDEENYRRHLRYLIETEGVTAITINGHASEVASLTLDEQQRSLAIALEEANGKTPIIAGVYEDGSQKATEIANMAEKEGADCLLIFPSGVFEFGSQQKPEMFFNHYATIADATDLPMIAFVYPFNNGLHINTESLIKICNDIDNVIAVKEFSNNIAVYERNYRELKALDKYISVLSSYSKSLLPSLCIGADGILSGCGSVIADLQIEIFEAVKRENLTEARRVADKLYPLNEMFYSEPFLDMHNRMKVANALLGRIDAAYIRPPFQPISDGEREKIRKVITEAGL